MRLRESWHSFWKDPAGQRFQRRYERLHGRSAGLVGRVVRLALGALLVLLGIVFMPLPGPGFVPLFLGAALMAGESRSIARGLDRAEVRVRGWLGK